MKREYEADGSVVSRIAVEEKYAGKQGVVHGGIQATLLDEVFGLTVLKLSEDIYGEPKPVVTATYQLKYKAPCPTQTELVVRSRIIKVDLPSVFVEGEICNASGEVLTRAEARWRIMGA